jgi:hypothetical protein
MDFTNEEFDEYLYMKPSERYINNMLRSCDNCKTNLTISRYCYNCLYIIFEKENKCINCGYQRTANNRNYCKHCIKKFIKKNYAVEDYFINCECDIYRNEERIEHINDYYNYHISFRDCIHKNKYYSNCNACGMLNKNITYYYCICDTCKIESLLVNYDVREMCFYRE